MNLFTRFKIYGTSEEMQSNILWNCYEGDINCRITIPLNF